jgi:hypothetical protein
MGADLTRYELRVGTVLSRAAIAAFHIRVTPTAVPRKTVYRFRIPADRDPSEVLHRLTEFDVQVLEIRRCFDVSSRDHGRDTSGRTGPLPEAGEQPASDAGVVVPFRARVHTPGFRPAPDGNGSAG